jgi:hypothetical protein
MLPAWCRSSIGSRGASRSGASARRRSRYHQRRDRGEQLEARRLPYILGTRARSDRLVRDIVLGDPAPFVPPTMTKRRHEVDYSAKAVTSGGSTTSSAATKRTKKDAAERVAILESLARQCREATRHSSAILAIAAFSKLLVHGRFAIDHSKAETDARFDGIFVLHTNAGLDPSQTMLRYNQLWSGGGVPRGQAPVRHPPSLPQARRPSASAGPQSRRQPGLPRHWRRLAA